MIRFVRNRLKEMAKVGSFSTSKANIEIFLYHESLKNPSFHIFKKGEWEFVLEIKTFRILEVKKKSKEMPYKKGDMLPKFLLKDLISFFKQIDDGEVKWKFLIRTWNSNNPESKISINTPIPDIF